MMVGARLWVVLFLVELLVSLSWDIWGLTDGKREYWNWLVVRSAVAGSLSSGNV